MADAEVDQILEAYRTPGHPIALSAPDAVARHFQVSRSKAKKALEQNDAYVLHREYKRPRKFNPYFIYKRRELVQADLIDIRALRAQNDGISYLLLLIDVFSRRIWVSPMKSKTGRETESALRSWIDGLRRKPRVFQSDMGREFTARIVQALLRSNNIEFQSALGTSKAAYAERANKSLQVLIYKYLTDRETLRYVEILDDLVRTYNSRGHRSLKYMSPLQADLVRNEARVRAVHLDRYHSVQRKRPRLKLGDIVRVKTDAKAVSSSRRAYAEQYHGEYFKIVRINRTLPIPMYYIQSMNSLEFIEGSFYAEELSRVKGNVFKVERVLERRGRGRNRQILVKWKHFSPAHNSWIREADIVDRF